MKSEINISHLIAVIIGIFIPLFIWGVTVETRLKYIETNKEKIQNIKTDIKDDQQNNQANFDKVLEKLQSIELKLKDKQDRN